MNYGIRLSVVFAIFAATLCSTSLFAVEKNTLWNKALMRKLKTIKLLKVDFESAKPLAVFKYLRKRSKLLDPDGKGVNFIFKHLGKKQTLVTIKMENIPLYNVIKYVCMAANLDFKVEEYAVVIQPKRAKKAKQIK